MREIPRYCEMVDDPTDEEIERAIRQGVYCGAPQPGPFGCCMLEPDHDGCHRNGHGPWPNIKKAVA